MDMDKDMDMDTDTDTDLYKTWTRRVDRHAHAHV
jgi:hypothetical protein